MHYLDKIESSKTELEKQKLHNQTIDAITNSGKAMVFAVEKLAISEDVNKELAAVTHKLSQTVENLDVDTLDKEKLTALQELKSSILKLEENRLKESTETMQALKELRQAIKGMEYNPVIKVAAPNVTLPEQKIDFTPLQRTMQEYFTPDSDDLDLSCYRAQDIKEDSRTETQYIGFLNPDGDWYIVENKVRENQMRWLFGSGDYAKAFAKAGTYNYKLLDEAVNALSA
jgi:hypothetical protein